MSRCRISLIGLGFLFGAGFMAAGADELRVSEYADTPSPSPSTAGLPTVEKLLTVASDSPRGIALGQMAKLLSSSATATTSLQVSVESNGSNFITVAPGAAVVYQVVGMLSDDANEGLALVGFNLGFDGGDLTHATIPAGTPTPGCDNPMINFTLPWGVANPDSPCAPACGFGGTIIGGDLVQAGGAQNTINNTLDNAPFPIGPVLQGIAQPGGCGAAVLVTGSLTAPTSEGTYSLSLTDLFSNVIRLGETGDPFWTTEAAGIGTITNLTIGVVEPSGTVPTVSGWGMTVMVLLLLTGIAIKSSRPYAQSRA